MNNVYKKGFYGIGVLNPKTHENIGTLWRSACNFGASFIFTIGKRYKKQVSDTIKTYKKIPLYHYETFEEFYKNMPYGCRLVGIEQSEKSKDIKNFTPLSMCIYLLGAEDHGLPQIVLEKCHEVIHINTPQSINVAVAGSIVMFHHTSI